MKILHVISGLTKGGGERMVVELANKSVENLHDVTILAGWKVDYNLLQFRVDKKIPVIFISKEIKYSYTNIFLYIIRNKKFLSKFDVIHCHLTYGAVFGFVIKQLTLVFTSFKEIAVIETYHAVGMKIPFYMEILRSMILSKMNGIAFMADDKWTKQFKKNHPFKTICTIPNGIEITIPSVNKTDLKKLFDIPESCTFLIGTIGMLRADRIPWIYVSLMQEIKQQFNSNVHLILGGSGEELQKIQDEIIDKKLQNDIHLIGLVDDPTTIMEGLDLYVSLSVGPITGISMIEAAMSGVPVIGIQLDKVYVAKASDWVWSHTEVKKVAEKIIIYLKDKEEKKRLIKLQYQQVINNYSSEAMFKKYDLFYREVIYSMK